MNLTQLNKWREERLAREKARLDKLRHLNMKKYTTETNSEQKMAGPSRIETFRKSIAPNKQTQSGSNIVVTMEEKVATPSSNSNFANTSRKTIDPSSKTQIGVKSDVTKTDNNNKMSRKTMDPSIKTQIGSKSDVTKKGNVTGSVKNSNVREMPKKQIGFIPATNVANKQPKIPLKSESTSDVTKKSNTLPTRKSMIPNVVQKIAGASDGSLETVPEVPGTNIPTVNQISRLFQPAVPIPNKLMSRKSMVPAEQIKKRDQVPSRKTMIPSMLSNSVSTNVNTSRKSFITAKASQSAAKPKTTGESVFERLYKPKKVAEKPFKSDVEKLKSDSKFRDKVIRDTGLILNKRHTVFEKKSTAQPKPQPPVRRSISAVHFKRISKSELANCIHKWASTENVSKQNLKDINEDDSIKEDKVVSAVKSERKKVKFQKPVYMNFNTPKPEELQARLKNWLQRRGKALNSYHHLQCFGLHHLALKEKESLKETDSLKEKESYDDEDKENVAVECDSDNESYTDNMESGHVEANWRKASYVSSAEFDDTKETIGSEEVEMHNVDELLLGALNDLTDLLREGFDWEQCARWLRAIRERFPTASETAPYWECRAALEERQGNLPQTLQCWEEAVVKGTERSVVEANLDQLLDKFMQLKISPHSAKKSTANNSKMIDVKNAFKSTIIRFAVQQAKIRQSNQQELYTVTPVRRSGRLSHCAGSSVKKTPRFAAAQTPRPAASQTPRSKRTPLVQICSSMRHIDASLAGKTVFVANATLPNTP